MLNWYRALVPHSSPPDRTTVGAPTLVVWGEDDPALVPDLACQAVDRCDDAQLEALPEASHWINHERPDAVAGLLLDHPDG
jgi:pimeloyl-ACP methyl ester carboxylesterase